MCGTLLTMLLGEAVLAWLPGDGDSAARSIGGTILVLLGTREILCHDDRNDKEGGGVGEHVVGDDDGELPIDVDPDGIEMRRSKRPWEVIVLAFGSDFH